MISATFVENEVLTPPLKWAGGKRWLVPLLKEYWRSTSTVYQKSKAQRRLVEPFVGGMAVALGLQPKRAQLNDFNPHLINFYTWIQRGLRIEIPLKNDSSYYYECRQRFNELIRLGQANSVESAQLFYFMNRTCFNGLCRFNRQDQFNVPFGKYKNINYQTDFSKYTAEMQNWKFSALDFSQLEVSNSDFIYADPPYDVEFTQYSAKNFKWEEQVRLAEWLSLHKGPVVASNQATPRIIKLYTELGFAIDFVHAPRRISCNGDRSYATEILAFKGM